MQPQGLERQEIDAQMQKELSNLAYLAYPDHQPAGDRHKAGWVGNGCIVNISNWLTLHIQITSQQGTATRLGGWEMAA